MSGSVLIVDDSLTIRMDLVEAFTAAGFRAVPCASVAEAREALEHAPVSIVILDVLLPDGDGVELLKEIRASARGASITILMLSTESEVKDRVRALQTGADEYIGKPYDTSYMVSKARELLRARETGSEASAPTILVIDDSVTYREELRGSLERAGYSVILAATGEEGLRIAADRRPSALVVDGVMPGIDGATVIRRVRLDAALRGTPCLLLTASEDRGAELRALDVGADAFVRKEEDIDVMLAKLGAVLRRPETASAGGTVSLAGPRKILAVDDSQTYLQELAATLRVDGYDVVLARSGEEALELLAVQSVDCVLLDLVMPGLGGRETCRRIKAAPAVREVPLIMLTALEDRSAMLEGFSAGADDYIQKSGEFEVLKARIRAQLRRKQFEDENRHIREELLRKELEASEARAARELAETRAALVGELEEKNRELESFSYSVSHDLRAPLRAIDGFSRILLEEHAERLDAEGRRLLDVVRGSAQRMGHLIDDLLAFSRAGRTEMTRANTDMTALAGAVFSELVTDQAEGMRIELRLGDLLPAAVDPALMRQVWTNLLANAVKYTRPREHAVVEVTGHRDGDRLVYRVRDNGVGFDMEFAGKLFGVFQRLHSMREFEGTGVGLALVKRIVGRHGGDVWAEGRVGEGATFGFWLPDRRGDR